MTDVLILSTGGTIASTAGEEGARPTEAAEDLVAAVPGLRNRIVLKQLAQRPSPDMDFELLNDLRERAAAHDAGVIVTHGTDTMAESAFYLDLVHDWEQPVVLTGAQRRPDQPGADGPANTLAAVTVAEEPAVRSAGGVYICLNGEVHAARDAVKAHTWRPDTFESPGKGPVAAVAPDGLERYRELGSYSTTLPDAEAPDGDVPIITTGIEVERRQIDRAVEAGADGIVLQTTGLGNAPKPVAESVSDAIDAGVPVVVTSRCHAGRVAAVYGGGGGYALQQHGAVLAGDLPAQKARIKLLLALSAAAPVPDVFNRRHEA